MEQKQLKISKKLSNLNPDNPEALTLKAKVYSLINNYAGAISLLE